MSLPLVPFREILRPNSRPYNLAADEDANLVGMRLYGAGPFHRELKPAMQIAKKSHFVIRSGDVIYNKLFAWKGTFGLVPDELDGMFVSDKFPTYELDRDRVDEQFLKWFFRHPGVWQQAQSKSTGSAALSKLTLNPPKFLELEIPLPDVHEQRRIVERIVSLSGKIETAKDLRESVREQTSILFEAACDVALERARASSPSAALATLVEPQRGISYGIVQTGTEFPDGVPTLRAGDLQWFRVNTADVKRVDPALAQSYQRTKLRGGELLLRIRGGVGEVAICPPEMIGGNVSREIAVIPLLPTVDPRFAMFMLAARASQQKMHSNVRGTSYVGINLKDVRELEIPLPDIREQRDIVHGLEAIHAKIQLMQRLQGDAAMSTNAMMPAILDKAFKGEL